MDDHKSILYKNRWTVATAKPPTAACADAKTSDLYWIAGFHVKMNEKKKRKIVHSANIKRRLQMFFFSFFF